MGISPATSPRQRRSNRSRTGQLQQPSFHNLRFVFPCDSALADRFEGDSGRDRPGCSASGPKSRGITRVRRCPTVRPTDGPGDGHLRDDGAPYLGRLPACADRVESFKSDETSDIGRWLPRGDRRTPMTCHQGTSIAAPCPDLAMSSFDKKKDWFEAAALAPPLHPDILAINQVERFFALLPPIATDQGAPTDRPPSSNPPSSGNPQPRSVPTKSADDILASIQRFATPPEVG